ncbi:MAG: hypothetical protein PHE43_01895 [Candidatus Nanoarchaeia archaeon]|nr:hypothetical protein [Candidatus Nanoarchaeia archaeon]
MRKKPKEKEFKGIIHLNLNMSKIEIRDLMILGSATLTTIFMFFSVTKDIEPLKYISAILLFATLVFSLSKIMR